MPNITAIEQQSVKSNDDNVLSSGQLNYLITLALIAWFKSHPRYEMIHELYKDFVQDPKHNEMLKGLESRYADRFTVADIRTAAALAYLEFHRRVVARYEGIKIKLNGELPEYIELYAMMDALDVDHIKEAVDAVDEKAAHDLEAALPEKDGNDVV